VILGIDHLDLQVEDIDKTVALFDKLGFQEIRRSNSGGLAVEMRLPGESQPTFDIRQVKEGGTPGVRHVAMQVDDCAATVAELESVGVRFESAPRRSDRTGRTVCTLTEAAGCTLQLAQ
jgi:4-hydroxyphenylpyruvate dioxygenase-like putative hemolysin